jgi:hypothetical protein
MVADSSDRLANHPLTQGGHMPAKKAVKAKKPVAKKAAAKKPAKKTAKKK